MQSAHYPLSGFSYRPVDWRLIQDQVIAGLAFAFVRAAATKLPAAGLRSDYP